MTAYAIANPATGQEVAELEAAEDDRATIGATYVTDVMGNIDGGLKPGAAWLGRADVLVDLPASRFGLGAGTVHFDLMGVHGRDFSGSNVGDAQIVSSIQAPTAVRLFEAWLELPLNRDGLSGKVGLIDLNTEFDVQSVGALFTNSSSGTGPDLSQTGANGPSLFPVTSIAAVAKLTRPGGGVRLGVFNAISGNPRRPRSVLPNLGFGGGALVILEADHAIGVDREVQIGAWMYTRRSDALAETDAIDPQRRYRQRGVYAKIEGLIAKAGRTRIDAWLRGGITNDHVQAIGSYVGGGITTTRGEQQAGFAVAHARLGDPAIVSGIGDASTRAETILELTYSTPAASWLRVQPAAQYVINPSWQPSTQNALVLGLRLVFQTALIRF